MNALMKGGPGAAYEYQSLLLVVHGLNNTTTKTHLILVKHDRLAGCNCTLWLFEMNNVSVC